jgi:hypothetical protein
MIGSTWLAKTGASLSTARESSALEPRAIVIALASVR